MITSYQLAQKRNELSKIIGPVMPSELPNWRIDTIGLLEYAKKKKIPVSQLTDEEKVTFITEIEYSPLILTEDEAVMG